MPVKKYIYYTGSSAHIPVRFWTYSVFTEEEFDRYRKYNSGIPSDLKKEPYTPERWEELTNH